jgi:hypothetical protein
VLSCINRRYYLWPSEGRGFTGCGKTLHGCHPERSEGSRSAYLVENAQGQILRFAQNDSFEGFFRSLLNPNSEVGVVAVLRGRVGRRRLSS